MKNLFPHYRVLNTEDFDLLWQKATFIFDTNILLNCYRYTKHTTEEFFDILNKISNRIWIPHHVALEFYRNQYAIKSEQIKVFNDINDKLNIVSSTLDEIGKIKDKHSSINPEEFISTLKTEIKQFTESMRKLEEEQRHINQSDEIKNKIEHIFKDNVGKVD